MVPHPDRPWLVVVCETAPSELVCARVEDDGGLRVLSRRATGGDFGCHLALTADGRQVVVAHYGSGSVESFGLDDDGQLTGPLDRYVSTAPLGPDPVRQAEPHAHQAVLDPHRPGEVLVCDLGTDRVHRLLLGPDGRLTERAPALVLPAGFGPRHLVVAGDTLVVAGELTCELWFGRRDGTGWRPTQLLPTTRRTAAERARAAAPPTASALRLAGDQLVVATRGVDTVSVFSLDHERSTATFAAEVSCGGRHPRDVVVADGLLWVADQWSDEVVVLGLAAVASGVEAQSVLRVPIPRPAGVVAAQRASTAPRADSEERYSARRDGRSHDRRPGAADHPLGQPGDAREGAARRAVRRGAARHSCETCSRRWRPRRAWGWPRTRWGATSPSSSTTARTTTRSATSVWSATRSSSCPRARSATSTPPTRAACPTRARTRRSRGRTTPSAAGRTPTAQPVEIHGDGLLARCLQHETDHLNGIVFGDRLSGRARKRLRLQHDDLAPRYPADWPVSPRLGPAPEDDDEDAEL